MAALTAAEREYLSNEWRFDESSSATIKARHFGAREQEYGTAFMTPEGAAAAKTIIVNLTVVHSRLVIATVDGIPNFSFRSRPRTVRLYHRRFGGDPVSGKLMMVESASVDYGAMRTTLNLVG